MADKPASERTEKPTPERLRKAREEGQIPESQEVPSAVMVGLLLLVLVMGGGTLMSWLTEQLRDGLSLRGPARRGGDVLSDSLYAHAVAGLLAVMPFLMVAAVASVASSFVTSGWSVSTKALQPKWDRLAFGNGMKQLFSVGNLAKLVVALIKTTVILWVVYDYLKDKLDDCMAMRWSDPPALITGIGALVLGATGRIVLCLTAIAAADLLFQRWRYKRGLRMSRQELKEERRQHEVAPEIRSRMRSIQMEMVRKRMLQDVPKADVVLVNPTHVAVALQYAAGRMSAPTVVAKGGDFMCEKIKEVARANGIPIVQRPELARALYAAVNVGDVVPESLYVAVAEILAMIYRQRRKRLAAQL